MNKIELNLDKSKKYVVACSFGPDSMSLLHACIQEGLDIVVAHVNYHKRDVSNSEQERLEMFCNQNNIICEVLDTSNLKPEGNFQEWARETRYNFFKNVSEKHKAYAVLVAHQQDDLIETYLMQKQRGNIVKYWGIAQENELFGVRVVRPLLDYTKQQLEDYDKENNVPYSIDESNLTDHYTRNQFRHHIVPNLSKKEREDILYEIKNQKVDIVGFDTELDVEVFEELDYKSIVAILDYYMNIVGEHRDLSQKFIEQIKVAFKSYSNMWFNITDSIGLELNYGIVSIINRRRLNSYEFDFIDHFKNDFIEIDFSNGAEDRGIVLNHEQLIVKNVNPKDLIKISDYEAEIRRLFIDWKVPHYLRSVWPGIYTKDGKLIYVPRYRKEFVDEHKSVFKIRTAYFREF